MTTFEVIWTDFAQNALKKIHSYYVNRANKTVAKKITESIIFDSLKLKTNPEGHQTEFWIDKRGISFRYLVSSHYKIIFWINDLRNQVVVVNVFDTRRNPNLMSEF